jgi:hypothetical protein
VRGDLLLVLGVHARQIFRGRHHRLAPRVAFPLVGCAFNVGSEGDLAVLPLGWVSTGVSMNQSVEFNSRCAGELSEVPSGIPQKQ